MTAFDPMLKELYAKNYDTLVYSKNPLLALINKVEDGGGSEFVQPIQYGTGGRRSATFANAQTAAIASFAREKAFHATWCQDYALARIDGLTIAASMGSEKAFVEVLTNEIDACVKELTNTIARDFYRSGWGDIGVVSTIPGASTSITLTNVEDADNFEVGAVCVFSLSQASDTLRNSGAGLTVVGVDHDSGTITFNAALSTESAVAGDTVFIKGDRQNSATPTRLKLSGLGVWVPTAAPTTGDSFFGVDRSADATRLGGLRYAPPAGTSIDMILQNAAYRVGRQGGELSHFMMSYGRLNDLVAILGSKAQYINFEIGKVGFGGVQIIGPDGPIDCVADRNCSGNRIYGLDMSTWKLVSMGKMVQLANTGDGVGKVLRVTDSDAAESRWRFYGQAVCSAPGKNVVVSITDPIGA